jgi:hypothetical protein
VFERVGIDLADQFGRDLRTVETLGNAVERPLPPECRDAGIVE